MHLGHGGPCLAVWRNLPLRRCSSQRGRKSKWQGLVQHVGGQRVQRPQQQSRRVTPPQLHISTHTCTCEAGHASDGDAAAASHGAWTETPSLPPHLYRDHALAPSAQQPGPAPRTHTSHSRPSAVTPAALCPVAIVRCAVSQPWPTHEQLYMRSVTSPGEIAGAPVLSIIKRLAASGRRGGGGRCTSLCVTPSTTTPALYIADAYHTKW
jgi:hypothetical protein